MSAEGKVKAKLFDEGTPLTSLTLIPTERKPYYQHSTSFIEMASSLVLSPSALMLGVTIILMLIVGKIDPEAMKQMQQEVSEATGGEQAQQAPTPMLPSLIH